MVTPEQVGDAHRDPGVLERLGGRDPLGRVDGQHLVDEVFGFGRHRVPLRRGKLRRGAETPQWTPVPAPIKGTEAANRVPPTS